MEIFLGRRRQADLKTDEKFCESIKNARGTMPRRDIGKNGAKNDSPAKGAEKGKKAGTQEEDQRATPTEGLRKFWPK